VCPKPKLNRISKSANNVNEHAHNDKSIYKVGNQTAIGNDKCNKNDFGVHVKVDWDTKANRNIFKLSLATIDVKQILEVPGIDLKAEHKCGMREWGIHDTDAAKSTSFFQMTATTTMAGNNQYSKSLLANR